MLTPTGSADNLSAIGSGTCCAKAVPLRNALLLHLVQGHSTLRGASIQADCAGLALQRARHPRRPEFAVSCATIKCRNGVCEQSIAIVQQRLQIALKKS